mmetsp:Transcript_27220/g.26262  ORF Transcript_27220/g.26262 Transcript_27220/m.26262 type:complete len:109 (+) Transcript_27220:106-432(+)|eukprot:CAMPEP_0170561900 /NCGR_PEP_ID=MMETSP0211-20121228/57663_1 /TAXON_ID=311385 /ORGANISM="Pseudokeronopsis sp., Strain OXSARD2" /LENGTH=108 /DNA_ID=CAMNT_0010878069 /DNA_START=283 /DNA_END=609 /DNA_ORIENTATION=-
MVSNIIVQLTTQLNLIVQILNFNDKIIDEFQQVIHKVTQERNLVKLKQTIMIDLENLQQERLSTKEVYQNENINIVKPDEDGIQVGDRKEVRNGMRKLGANGKFKMKE